MRRVVELLGREDCCLCDDALVVLERMQADLGFDLHKTDITLDDELHRAYFERIPVVRIDGREVMQFRVDERALREHLESAA